MNCNRITINNKNNEIETLNSQQGEKQKAIDEALAKVETQKVETSKVKRSMCSFFDLGQHDFSFISNARSFNNVEKATAAEAAQ